MPGTVLGTGLKTFVEPIPTWDALLSPLTLQSLPYLKAPFKSLLLSHSSSHRFLASSNSQSARVYISQFSPCSRIGSHTVVSAHLANSTVMQFLKGGIRSHTPPVSSSPEREREREKGTVQVPLVSMLLCSPKAHGLYVYPGIYHNALSFVDSFAGIKAPWSQTLFLMIRDSLHGICC